MSTRRGTCVICHRPLTTKLGFRLWMKVNGFSYHPTCFLTMKRKVSLRLKTWRRISKIEIVCSASSARWQPHWHKVATTKVPDRARLATSPFSISVNIRILAFLPGYAALYCCPSRYKALPLSNNTAPRAKNATSQAVCPGPKRTWCRPSRCPYYPMFAHPSGMPLCE